ncbi:MAG TPA: trypsin-like peptidase domain-containing protein [Gemmatimonadales bacterium]|nr:trypsin-like peptidase domain-containing protein [Gemmatimonadales bacterium]
MAARIVFLTGSKSGTVVELTSGEVSVGRNPTCSVALSPDEVVASGRHATFFVREGRCFVRDDGSRNGTFVDGVRVETVELRPGQQVTFGPNGPSARFEMASEEAAAPGRPRTEFAAPLPPRAPRAAPVPRSPQPAGGSGLTGLYQMARQHADGTAGGRASNTAVMKAFVMLATERTSRRMRITVAAVLATALVAIVIVFAVGQGEQASLKNELVTLSGQLAGERGSRAELEQRLQNVTAQAQTWQTETAELRAQSQSMRQTLAQSQVTAARERREIEQDRRFGPTVTDRFSQGVCLIELQWGYRNSAGEWLRIRGAPNGDVVLADANDRDAPRLTDGGTGTGFLIDGGGWILTNRHVSEPFTDEDGYKRGDDLYRPTWISRRAYFPPGNRVVETEVVSVSHESDLGLMRTTSDLSSTPVLPISPRASVVPGDKLVLLGYPTGGKNIMWRANETQMESIRAAQRAALMQTIRDGGFEGVIKLIDQAQARTIQLTDQQTIGVNMVASVISASLSHAALQEAARLGLVQPHVSMGEVTDTTRTDVFHSAAMVGGASGGPVVGSDLHVISVNYAMNVSEDRGAVFQKNRSVPYTFIWRFVPPDLAARMRNR